MILYTFTSYLPHSQSQAVPALPGQNSMPIGWGNLGHLFYWLKIPQICCCYIWGCLEPRWGRKVPQLIPQNFKHPDSCELFILPLRHMSNFPIWTMERELASLCLPCHASGSQSGRARNCSTSNSRTSRKRGPYTSTSTHRYLGGCDKRRRRCM